MDRRIEIEDSIEEPGKVEFTIPLNDFQSTGFSIKEDVALDLLDALMVHFYGQPLFSYEEEAEDRGREEGYDEGYADAEWEADHQND